MGQIEHSVESIPIGEISPELMRAGMKLNALVWPSSVPVTERVEKRQAEAQRDSEAMSRVVWHFVREGEAILAMARTFRRVVADESGRAFPVLALAGVCTHPEHRKRGLGRAVVLAAWERIGTDLPVCYFQTGVPAFYEGLGARQVTNRLFDTTGAAKLFWDPFAMIYPAEVSWPDGGIDLRGGGW